MRCLFGSCVVVLMVLAASLLMPVDVYAETPNKPLDAKEMELAVQMNKAYASHVYASTCFDRQRSLFVPKILNKEEVAKRLASIQKSCDCMADLVIKATSPNDVIDYITERNGINLKKITSDKDGEFEYTETPQFTKIREMTYGDDLPRKCGFSK